MRKENLELWTRNPVECIQELLGKTTLAEHIKYEPEKIWREVDGKRQRVYGEAWTADRWWQLQVLDTNIKSTNLL